MTHQATNPGNTAASVSFLSVLASLFNRQWRWATVIVIIGMLFLARLGIWQLDRLDQRRAINAQLEAQISQPPFQLDPASLPKDIETLKYRQATVSGRFDYEHELLIKLQNWDGPVLGNDFVSTGNAAGVDIITPFIIEGAEQAILVNRGWIPEAQKENLAQFQDSTETQSISGYILQTEPMKAEQATAVALQFSPANPQTEWYRVDIGAIQNQIPYPLLPVYLEQAPPQTQTPALPYKQVREFDLSEGPHFGYAMQWFIFSAILGLGYLAYVAHWEKNHRFQAESSTASG